MPAALLSHDDWQEVKATAIALGSLIEAARRHQLPAKAVYERARREEWPTGRRPEKMARIAREQARAVTQSKLQAERSTVATAGPNSERHKSPVIVSSGDMEAVDTASATLSALRSDGNRTRSAAMRAARKAAEHAAELPGEDLLTPSVARALRDHVGSASVVGDWGAEASGGGAQVQFNVLSNHASIQLLTGPVNKGES